LSFTTSSIILGATANGLNNNKFLGYANNFQSRFNRNRFY
jgi:hypothetical protein